jgi:hypothetical protein
MHRQSTEAIFKNRLIKAFSITVESRYCVPRRDQLKSTQYQGVRKIGDKF